MIYVIAKFGPMRVENIRKQLHAFKNIFSNESYGSTGCILSSIINIKNIVTKCRLHWFGYVLHRLPQELTNTWLNPVMDGIKNEVGQSRPGPKHYMTQRYADLDSGKKNGFIYFQNDIGSRRLGDVLVNRQWSTQNR